MPAIVNSRTTDAGIFLWLTYQTLCDMGLDAAAIFASVNLPNQPPDKTVRRANHTQQRFWAAAAQISDDADIGLHVGAKMPTFRGQVVEYLFLSSATFGQWIAGIWTVRSSLYRPAVATSSTYITSGLKIDWHQL